MMDLKKHLREFQDFPSLGINFKDISPLLASPDAMDYVLSKFTNHFHSADYDAIAGAESRGLLFASAFATRVHKSCVMVRKKGKLPGPTIELEYGLEYGQGILEMQQDAIKPGDRVLIVDDLLATGGTAKAAAQLIEELGGVVVGFAFVIELAFLHGRKVIEDYDIQTLVTYHE